MESSSNLVHTEVFQKQAIWWDNVREMTTVSSASAIISEFMTKTPFLKARSVSSSFEDEEDEEEEEEEAFNHDHERKDEQLIEISKKVVPKANAMPVVNKMNQHVYNDHQNPPKGTITLVGQSWPQGVVRFHTKKNF